MLISQSEADARNACERKHFYMFGEPTQEGRGIEPLTLGSGLAKGNLGHSGLEVYYKARLAGDSHSLAMEQALLFVMQNDSEHSMDMLTLLSKYFEFHGDEMREDWEPLVIEQEFRYPIPGTDFIFPFKVDGVFRHKPSDHLYVWDHKFLWRYYKPNAMKILPQLPKYVYVLRKMGFPIYDAMYNMISTQANSKEPTRREPLNLYRGEKQRKMENLWAEQVATMIEIKKLKEGDIEEWRAGLNATRSAFNCTNCSFLELCIQDLEGQPGRDLTINNFYRPNSYGYAHAETD